MREWTPSRWLTLAFAILIVAGAISLALMIPGEKCVSGFDNSVCVDNSTIKWTVALAGVAIALVVLAVGALIRRQVTRRLRV